MRGIGKVLGALVVALLLPAAVYAQGSIAGSVKDTSGAVLPGVTVEAASPVLIEKVRTVVTDGNGRFQIIDLRPGTYTVTFTLAGFNTTRRDAVAVSGGGVATIDAELRVGALEETITVTGEAPVVDTQSVAKQQVLSADVVDALPSARNYVGLARMIPGTNASGNGSADVGGSLIQDVGGSLTVHGSKTTDQRVTANGINTMTLQAGGNIGGQTPDVGSAAEVTVDTTSLAADLPTGGVRINFVPRDGGNNFSNSTFFSVSDDALQGDNLTSRITSRGFATANKIVSNFDINESLGGPIKRDKVWFWYSTRFNKVSNEGGIFLNANAFNTNSWLFNSSSDPAINKGKQFNNSLRVTWQATPKLKVAGTYKADKWCNCPSQIGATRAFEASRDRRFPRLRQEHAEFTSPVTNKLLLEGVFMHLYERWGDMHLREATGSLTSAQEALLGSLIAVQDQTTGLRYRNRETNNNTQVPNFAYRAAASYVTGTHAFKLGFNRTHGFLNEYQYALNPLEYRVVGVWNTERTQMLSQTPNRVTMHARPFRAISELNNDFGLFLQDRWTMDRLTLSMAGRLDIFQTGFPEQTVGSTLFTPGRNITFAAQDNLNWKDFTFRSGVSYDLFGTGKTALKVAANKYLLGQTLNGIGRNPNPVLAMQTSTTRSWTDNGNMVVDCVLTNPAAQNNLASGGDNCGAWADATFGQSIPAQTYDANLRTGWGHRPSNYEFTASIQHELARGIGVDFGYFRRVWNNFTVTDAVLTDGTDIGLNAYDRFNMVVPGSATTPGFTGNAANPSIESSGQTLTGLVAIKPEFFGRAIQRNRLSTDIGKQTEHWNGFDINMNARLQNGLTMQAGVSTGKTTENDCDIVSKIPELTVFDGNQRAASNCDRSEPMLTSFKAYGVYTVPRVDVQLSGTYRNTPGTAINANFSATNAYLAAHSTLGRALAGGAANIPVQLLAPNQRFNERRNELDVRIGKVLRFGKTRAVASIDLFNALNTDAIITTNQTYGAAFGNVTEILNARLIKFSVALDF